MPIILYWSGGDCRTKGHTRQRVYPKWSAADPETLWGGKWNGSWRISDISSCLHMQCTHVNMHLCICWHTREHTCTYLCTQRSSYVVWRCCESIFLHSIYLNVLIGGSFNVYTLNAGHLGCALCGPDLLRQTCYFPAVPSFLMFITS